jgi:hypothetical protein
VVVEPRFIYCLGDSPAVSYDLLKLNMLPTQPSENAGNCREASLPIVILYFP